jgi:hypothetical protein
MRRLIVLILFSINISVLYSQTIECPDSSTYSFFFFEGQISDTNKLELNVKYNNSYKQAILIHKNLVEDIEYGPVGNFYLDMEKFKDGKYEKFVDKTTDYFIIDENQPEDRRVYNELRSGDSAVLSFNLISRIGAVYKGKYRMRINLLKVPNNYRIRHDMEYATSRWFYFEVIKDLDYHDLY